MEPPPLACPGAMLSLKLTEDSSMAGNGEEDDAMVMRAVLMLLCPSATTGVAHDNDCVSLTQQQQRRILTAV